MKLDLKKERVILPRILEFDRKISLADIESMKMHADEKNGRIEISLTDGEQISSRKMPLKHANEIFKNLSKIIDPPKSHTFKALPLDEIARRFAEISSVSEVRASCLARLMFDQALKLGTSDIHLEGSPEGTKVIFRIDGVLHEAGTIAPVPAERLMTHLKVESGVASYRKDVPQEGRMGYSSSDRKTDLRVSFIPTYDTEKAVIRIFEKGHSKVAIDELGFSPHLYEGLIKMLSRRQGMILLTGPSASGKTTTIYSALQYMMTGPRVGAQVVTIEDPVERGLPGATQVQVDLRRDMTFSKLLGNLLRQDAEVIAVGEIRDSETAATAVQAALTGQLLLSTLHAGSAPEVAVRLLDLGIEPYRVASSLACTLSQRLVRLVCNECLEEYQPENDLLKEYSEWLPDNQTFKRGSGCENCFGTGYRGRTVIGELLEIDNEWQDILRGKPTSVDIMSLALEKGMKPMVADAVSKVCEGLTTLEEIKRVLG